MCGSYPAIFFILYDRIEKLADRWDASRAEILGYAIAHEIGHLVLSTGVHTPEGIMNARWGPKSLPLAARGKLVFSLQ